MKLIDFNNCEFSDRDMSYGGQAGDKDGIIYNGENWIIKYPQATRIMDNASISYTTSPLSEYVGSHIYEILGYDVHKTLLGERNDKIVVACKDFCKEKGDLIEMRTMKNSHNKELSKELQAEFHDSATGESVLLEELLLHLDNNRLLKNINGIKERFWDSVILDIFIDNNDRNNGNWGILRNKEDGISIAPVFDNGNSFANKASEAKLEKYLLDKNDLLIRAMGSRTAYSYKGHILSAKKMLKQDFPELKDAIKRVVPNILLHFKKIEKMILEIPEEYRGHIVCSKNQKKFMLETLKIRQEKMLEPALLALYTEKEKLELFENKKTDIGILICVAKHEINVKQKETFVTAIIDKIKFPAEKAKELPEPPQKETLKEIDALTNCVKSLHSDGR